MPMPFRQLATTQSLGTYPYRSDASFDYRDNSLMARHDGLTFEGEREIPVHACGSAFPQSRIEASIEEGDHARLLDPLSHLLLARAHDADDDGGPAYGHLQVDDLVHVDTLGASSACLDKLCDQGHGVDHDPVPVHPYALVRVSLMFDSGTSESDGWSKQRGCWDNPG